MSILLRYLLPLFICFILTGCSSNLLSPSDASSGVTSVNQPTVAINVPKKVVLLLPLQGPLSGAGTAARDGFITAYNNDASTDKPAKISVIDTSQQPVTEAYKQAVQADADVIVGPLTKNEVQTLLQTNNLSVTTLTLNYLDNSQKTPANLFQFGLSPLDEARQAAALARRQGGQRAIIMVPRSNWGQALAQTYQNEWQTLGGTVTTKLFFSEDSSELNQDIHNTLNKYKTSADVILLAASPTLARQIKPLLKFYYAGNMPVYATSLIYTGTPQATFDNDLNGIIFCDTPWTLSNENSALKLRQQIALFWPVNFKQNSRLYALGIDAYALIKNLARLATANQVIINGATGDLSINNQRLINRTLTCAQFQQGIPHLLEKSVSMNAFLNTHNELTDTTIKDSALNPTENIDNGSRNVEQDNS